MAQQAVWVFDKFENAQRAYDELRAQGVAAEQLQWKVSDDEAGPVQDNFWVGNADPEADDGAGASDSEAGENDSYERDFAHPAQVGSHVLVVSGAADQARAEAVARRLGGTRRD